MPSLKEIKGRISSVRSTLKITSAMKLVASAKLHRAQLAIGNMLPYEHRLHEMLVDLMAEKPSDIAVDAADGGLCPENISSPDALTTPREVRRVAIVAFSSNSSLCGSFNASVIRETVTVIQEYLSAGLSAAAITVYPVGRKMADAIRKLGWEMPADFAKLAESPNYEDASALAQELLDGFLSGRFDRIELVYNHYRSTASQPTLRQVFLPLQLNEEVLAPATGKGAEIQKEKMPHAANPEDYIIEPGREEVIKVLLPKVIRLRIYATLLDSAAAEHAARTVAMQTATDNGQDLLEDLTLDYNKSRQQKITNEILDIVSGSLS